VAPSVRPTTIKPDMSLSSRLTMLTGTKIRSWHVKLWETGEQAIHEGGARSLLGRVHDDAGRIVDDDHGRILEGPPRMARSPRPQSIWRGTPRRGAPDRPR